MTILDSLDEMVVMMFVYDNIWIMSTTLSRSVYSKVFSVKSWIYGLNDLCKNKAHIDNCVTLQVADLEGQGVLATHFPPQI
jgi:hypothetical protein